MPSQLFLLKLYPTLKTKCLTLRRPYLTDVDDIFRCTGDINVCRFENWDVHKSEIETLSFINSLMCRFDENTCTDWIIERKKDKHAIGMINLHNIDKEEKTAEIGYWIARDCWGNNYATEAVSSLLNFAFKNLKLTCIYGLCHNQNKASLRVMEKCGMTFLRSEDIYFNKEKRMTELYIYSISK